MTAKRETTGLRVTSPRNDIPVKAMIRQDNINAIKRNIHVGESLPVPAYSQSEINNKIKSKTMYATVVAKYDNFVLVTNGKYKWSVKYIDLIGIIYISANESEEILEVNEDE